MFQRVSARGSTAAAAAAMMLGTIEGPKGEVGIMDRDEAMRLLRGGSKGIYQWNNRRCDGEIFNDLRGTDLRGADLRGADLTAAQFRGADLDGADLGGSELSGADLRGVALREAKLREANLREANLSGADLREADLREADLTAARLTAAYLNRADLTSTHLNRADLTAAHLNRARFSGADLREADFRGADLTLADLAEAKCGDTGFSNVDLLEVLGLDRVVHQGPSSVGVDTLVRSKGKIPESFLRGCGVPEALIAYLPSLIGSMAPIQFYSCFISYSTKDEDFATRLHGRMVQEKLRVWYAPEDLLPGRKIHEEIDQAIRIHDKLILVLSEDSISSKWVRDEIRRARNAEVREGRRKLFPIRLIGYEELRPWESFYADLVEDLAEEVREYFIPDFSGWKDHDAFEREYARLLAGLKLDARPA